LENKFGSILKRGKVMAEDVNFPLDQSRNTSTIEFLREALRESGRPRGIEDQEKELNNPDRFREEQKQQPVNDLGSLESRVELFQGVRQQPGENLRNLTDLRNQEAKQDIAEAERRELQASGGVLNPDRVEEFEDVTRIDVGSLESRVELFQGAHQQAGEDLRNPTELKNQEAKQDVALAERRELQASGGVLNPDRVEEFEDVTRIDVGSLESRVELFQGASPQAGEKLRNPTDASALETERGQNISSLI
jgi:hypothetical protein